MSADEEKAKGNAAFKAKQYAEAVTHFTAAIAADSGNHVLYSNRSAAYAGQEDYKNALLDADKCIELKPDWAKGHSRRGAAFVGLKKLEEATKAYEAGLAIDPDSANIKQELASLKATLGSAAASAATANAPPKPQAAPSGVLGRLAAPLNALILVTAFFYVVPLLGARRAMLSYRVSVGSALLLYASSLFARHPLKFATLRDPAVTGSHEAQLCWLCLIMLVSPPLPFAIVPFGAYALHSVATNYGHVVQKMPGMLRGFVQPRLTFILSEEGGNMVQAFAAISELMVLLAAPLQVAIHGGRVVVLSGFYFQYLARRYVASFWTQHAVKILSEKAAGIFHHRYCPAPVGMLFDRLLALIGSLAARVR